MARLAPVAPFTALTAQQRSHSATRAGSNPVIFYSASCLNLRQSGRSTVVLTTTKVTLHISPPRSSEDGIIAAESATIAARSSTRFDMSDVYCIFPSSWPSSAFLFQEKSIRNIIDNSARWRRVCQGEGSYYSYWPCARDSIRCIRGQQSSCQQLHMTIS